MKRVGILVLDVGNGWGKNMRRFKQKEIENAYCCVIERSYDNYGKKTRKAFDEETHEFICESSTLQKLVFDIPCAKTEYMYG